MQNEKKQRCGRSHKESLLSSLPHGMQRFWSTIGSGRNKEPRENPCWGQCAETAKLQAELQGLRSKLYAQREAISAVLQKTDSALRDGRRYPVRPASAPGQWETVTQWCCLGGCDLDIYSFATERDALLFSALLEALGYEPQRNTACSQCYAEYSRDMI